MAPRSALCEASRRVPSRASMSVDQVEHLFALALGFAVAGLIATGYQLVTRRPASFRLLQRGPRPSTFAAVPLLAFAAPFIIMRNTIRGPRIEGRGFSMGMVSTRIAGGWRLVSGPVGVMSR